jgi:hypothetical protein
VNLSALSPQELAELEDILKFRESLPHLYGFPWYKWAYEFFTSYEHANFLCAANQVSKSSTQIRKAIDWATDQKKWRELWPSLLPGQKPNQFWYFYPSAPVATVEWETKWLPDFMPKNQNDPVYGWKDVWDKGFIKQIEFNSGVTIYFKTYAQKLIDLQSGSVHAVFLDEEAPEHLMPEIQARLRAVKGYLHAVFTATIGQEYWRRVMEPKTAEETLYPHALKLSVSLYDSQKYMDGTPSRWTDERIAEVIAECSSEAEVQRRVFGRFVKSGGLRFESFDFDRNMIHPQPVQRVWEKYSGVDPGSGGLSGHPAAIIFVAVRPDYKEGYVFRGWRGDGIPTANPDILDKYRELKRDMLMTSAVYDYKDKDFFLIAQSAGEAFEKANKTRDEGYGLVNSLFKNGMLKIFRGDPELDKLVSELMSLSATGDKRKAADDLCDALRYCCMAIPWDFSDVGKDAVSRLRLVDDPPDLRSEEQRLREQMVEDRRKFALGITEKVDDSYASEIEFWNELNGAGND